MPKNKLKILLIKVPEVSFTEKKISYKEALLLNAPSTPLGIASLSAYMKQKFCHDIYLLDISTEGFSQYKANRNNKHFLELVEKRINDIMPDVIGISALMIVDYEWVHYIARIGKKIKPSLKIIVGGGYASFLPQRILEDVNVDFIVLGEGEITLLNIINQQFAKEKLIHLDGIGFRDKNGNIVINRRLTFIEDIDVLPFFDWEGIKLQNHLQHTKDRSLSYITSRGCPFGCSFCSTFQMWGKKFRSFSAKRVIDEIDYLVSNYDINCIEFRDDNFTLDKKRTKDILTAFVERKYNLKWTSPNALAISTLDRELLELFKISGCETLTIAIESGSERVIKDIIHKPINKNKVREIVKIAKDVGLKITANFVIGLPGETKEEIEETKDFILELGCDWNQMSIATAFPGTEIYDICEKNNYFVNSNVELDRYRYGFANIRTSDFDEKWLKEKTYDINIEVNFLKNENFKKDLQYAIVQFSDRLASYPRHLIAIFCLAYAYKQSGNSEKAKDTLLRAVDLIKKDLEIYNTYKKYIDPANPIFEDYFKMSNF